MLQDIFHNNRFRYDGFSSLLSHVCQSAFFIHKVPKLASAILVLYQNGSIKKQSQQLINEVSGFAVSLSSCGKLVDTLKT